MITIECPLCDGDATVAEASLSVSCDGCGVRLEVASEPTVPLAMAA
jgi:hypothetical protein